MEISLTRFFRNILFFVIAGYGCISVVSAQQPSFSRLDNGLELVIIQDSTLPVSTVSLAVFGGTYKESKELNGVSHLMSRLLIGPSQALTRMEAGSAYLLGSEPSLHHLRYTLHAPDHALQGILQLIGQRSRFMALDKGSLAVEKKEVFRTFERLEGDPSYLFGREFGEDLWRLSWPSKDLYGNVLSLSRLSVSTLESFFIRNFHPDQSMLIVQGPQSPEQITEWVNASLGNWPAVGAPRTAGPAASNLIISPNKTKFSVSINEFAKEPLMLFAVQTQGVQTLPREYQAGQLLATYLNLQSSPLRKALVTNGPLRDMQVSYQPGRNGSLWILSCSPPPDKLAESLAAVEREWVNIASEDYFDATLWETALRQNEFHKARLKENRDAWHAQMADLWSGMNMETLVRSYEEETAPLQLQAIKDFAQNYFLSPYSGALLINSEQSERYHANALATREEIVLTDSVPEVAGPSPLLWIEGYRIWFSENSYEPADSCQPTLVEVSRLMREFPQDTFFVNGYTDSRGDGVTNYQLSIERATYIKQILIDRFGIEAGRMLVRGYGEAFPEYDETTELNRARNRRVTFQVKGEEDYYVP